MSEHTARSARASKAHEAAPVAQEAAPQEAAAPAATPAVTIEISGINVTLPVKFRAGHMLTENQAKILDVAYQRQFRNNQNANIEARAERFAKTGKPEYAPLSATDIAAIYMDYEPTVGGAVRGNTLETLRHDTAWEFWSDLMARHNEAAASNGAPLIKRAVDATGKAVIAKLPFAHPGRAPKNAAADVKAAHEAKVAEYEAAKTAFIGRLLEHKEYGTPIATLVAAKLAAKKADKAPAPAAAESDVVISLDD